MLDLYYNIIHIINSKENSKSNKIVKHYNIYVGLKNKIEKVQRTFTKRLFYRCGIPYTNYENRLLFLNLIISTQVTG